MSYVLYTVYNIGTCSTYKCSIGFNKLHKHIETEMVQKLILGTTILFYLNVGIW